MPSSSRRFVGRFVLVVFVLVYIVAAMWIGAEFFPARAPLVQIAYFAVAGFAWVFPAMAIIKWYRRGRS